MSVGEINKGVVALLLVLVLGAGGYLWYSKMYQPAVTERTSAEASASTAQQGLQQAKTELQAAQDRLEQTKQQASKVDDAVSRVALASAAIPDKPLIDEAAVVLTNLAKQSGVSTSFSAQTSDSGGSTPAGNLKGATPIDIEFKAAGTYGEMMAFMRRVESTVTVERGKMFAKGRLFNVVSLEIGAAEGEASGSGGSSGFAEELNNVGPSSGADNLDIRPGDEVFTIIVRMYTSSTENAQGVGNSTPDPAAAGTQPGADQAAAGANGATNTTGTGTPGATDTTGAGTGTGTPGATDTTGGINTGAGTGAGGSNTTGGTATGAGTSTPVGGN